MITNNKILPIALVAALLGGSVGAFVMRPTKTTDATPVATNTTANLAPAHTPTADQSLPANSTQSSLGTTATLDNDQAAYREGYADGFNAAQSAGRTTSRRATTVSRVVYQPATRSRYARSSRQVYYDYEPRRRTFWQKHRDKLTVAMGTGAGAILGGVIGGKKGAAIGALSGAAGSALYTYKIRNRNHRY